MMSKDKFLVVVSVLEGKRFPKRLRHELIAEARFDGELLATDPVAHSQTPDFTQELAWELDKRGLHQHKLQRSSIKVQCYAVDTQSTMKELVGYVMLDIRSAQTKQTTKWYPLLNSKYSKNKPELKVGVYIDNDVISQQTFKAKDAPARRGEAPALDSPLTERSEVNPHSLKPVLNETEGWYQIGPEHKCTDQFILSVTVAFAANLTQLVPSNFLLPANANGYFFYYSLFGNDVSNEPFKDLMTPNFAAERASVRLRSSIDALMVFLSTQPGLELHLCCGDQSLGSSKIPLNSLLKKGSTEIYMKPVSIEGAFELIPPNRHREQLTPVPEELQPIVGISIVLKKEEQGISTPIKSMIPNMEMPSQPRQYQSPPEKLPKTHQNENKPSEVKKTPPKDQSKLKHPEEILSKSAESYTESFEEEKTDQDISNISVEQRKEDGAKTKKSPSDKTKTSEKMSPGVRAVSLPPDPTPSTESSTTQAHIAVPQQNHHFCFSIDLRSIRDFDTKTYVNVFLRYAYPFFGSAAPILTQPAVEVRRGTEVLLPQSFCAFNFATTPQQLFDTIVSVPLVVEVWDRDRQKAQDTILGVVKLPLTHIFQSEKTRIVKEDGTTGMRQTFTDHLPIISADGQLRKLGEIFVLLSLEDLGPINLQRVAVGEDTSQSEATTIGAPPPRQHAPPPVQSDPPQGQSAPPLEPRETQEYQAAMELEMWKHAQETVFEKQLRNKEETYMKTLAEEWKRRDMDREIIMKKKLQEYSELEKQLRSTLADVDRRDKQLAANEQEVMRLRVDLQREHERKLVETREASRRMKEDCEHQVALERSKVSDLEHQITQHKDQISEWEKKYQKLDTDFITYKEQQSSKPEVRLQSEISLLSLEKAELERSLDSVTKSKIHYKQQWGRALKEIARLKQKEQTTARDQLRKQQQELEHMRLRYLATEEQEVVKSERKHLEEIKEEMNKLKSMSEQQQQQLKQQQQQQDPQKLSDKASISTSMQPMDQNNQSVDDHITRLIEERDTLLRTGVYSTEDRIIAELDRQIRETIARKDR
ncbi:unnamed protein product [Owenia fusiformis]|uniref:C2 domain-containing protein n=1 Tax=Owenia fusiformis TaxID=6347 RepID=A0A8S4PVF6_OWEFU|nr:unnamed protein product [Owenia fusiformis]